MTAEEIVRALGGRAGMAMCPAHNDGRTPALSVGQSDSGRVLVHCHGGCPQADVIEALRCRGLWHEASLARPRRFATRQQPAAKPLREDDIRKLVWRDDIIRRSVPLEGTPGATYLATRGLAVPDTPDLRFEPDLTHYGAMRGYPGLVAVVRDVSGNVAAVHMTYLADDGRGKAPVEPQRKMLCSVKGAAVRLASLGPKLVVGEGIETVLSVMQSTNLPGWAALSAAGLRCLELPREVREVVIAADGDEPGLSAAWAAAARWIRERRTVRMMPAPMGFDWNDVLMQRASGAAA